MEGLLNQAPQQEMPQQEAPQTEEIEATPEEQQLFEDYFKAALGEVLGNPQAFKSMMKAIEATRNNPVDGIARIAMALYDKAEKKLGPMDDDDITEAIGEGIIEALLDMAEEGGILQPEEVNEDLATAIYVKMAQMWIEQNPDRADPDDLQYVEAAKGGRV